MNRTHNRVCVILDERLHLAFEVSLSANMATNGDNLRPFVAMLARSLEGFVESSGRESHSGHSRQ